MSGEAHHAPPQSVGEGGVLVVGVLLAEVDEEGGEDEAQKADVDGCEEFLETFPLLSMTGMCREGNILMDGEALGLPTLIPAPTVCSLSSL